MPKSNQLSDRPLSDEEILVKHAFRGSSYAVVRLEELTEIGNLKADAVACYRPVNSQELFVVEHIALCQQQILRGFRVEAGLFTTALDYCLAPGGETFRPMSEDLVGDGDIEITRAQNRNFAAGEGMRRMVKDSDVWTILLRYKINAERQYRRAVEDLERLKRLRPEMPNHPNLGTAPEVIDDIAPLRDINPLLPRDFVPRAPNNPVAAPIAKSSAEPVETSFEPLPAVSPDAPENDAPEDGAPLAPAAASTPKTQEPVSRIPGSNVPASGRLKVKPFASVLRRPANPRPSAPASKARRPVCRPVANPPAPHQPPESPSTNSAPDS